MYYKIIEDNILTAIGSMDILVEPCIEITEKEYNSIIDLIQDKPQDTEDTVYVLDAESMEYVPTERPIEPTPIEPSNPYGIEDELYDSIIDDYTMMLIEEGVIE